MNVSIPSPLADRGLIQRTIGRSQIAEKRGRSDARAARPGARGSAATRSGSAPVLLRSRRRTSARRHPVAQAGDTRRREQALPRRSGPIRARAPMEPRPFAASRRPRSSSSPALVISRESSGYARRPANPMSAHERERSTPSPSTNRQRQPRRPTPRRPAPRRAYGQRKSFIDTITPSAIARGQSAWPKAPDDGNEQREQRRDVGHLECVPSRRPDDDDGIAANVANAHEGESAHERRQRDEDRDDGSNVDRGSRERR